MSAASSRPSQFADTVASSLEVLEREVSETPFRVAVLGSAESNVDEGPSKRQQILTHLMDLGMDAFLPEQYVDTSAAAPVGDQERVVLGSSDVDFIVVLNTSVGPLAELASFQTVPSIVGKTFVLYPARYYNAGTYTASVLDQYINLLPFSDLQLQQCDLVPICAQRAKAFRTIKRRELQALQF